MNINKLGNELVRSKTNLNSIANALYFDWVFLFSSSSSLFSIFESFSFSPFLYNSRNFTPNDRIWIKNNENNYRMRGRGEKRKQKSSFFAFFLMLFQIIIITKTKQKTITITIKTTTTLIIPPSTVTIVATTASSYNHHPLFPYSQRDSCINVLFSHIIYIYNDTYSYSFCIFAIVVDAASVEFAAFASSSSSSSSSF